MVPYVRFEQFSIGPFTIHIWGLMVALGIILAAMLTIKLAKKYFLAESIALDGIIWMILGAFIFARLFHVVFYEPMFYFLNPVEAVKIWQGGASSTGGFFGAVFALYLFAKKRHLKLRDLLPYFDIWALSLWLGWGVGRIGCWLTQQHPGKLTNLFMGVNYSGGTRFDLGFLEFILGFLLFIIFSLFFNKLIKIRYGLVAGWSVTIYAIARFGLDFLRATDLPQSDARYLLLTPAQWFMLAIIITLALISLKQKFNKLTTV